MLFRQLLMIMEISSQTTEVNDGILVPCKLFIESLIDTYSNIAFLGRFVPRSLVDTMLNVEFTASSLP